MIGEALASRGHQVWWWTANFSHAFKQFRSNDWRDIPVSDNFQVRLVPTSGYNKNISLGRVRFELSYAWRAYRCAVGMTAPDLIFGTDPPQIVGNMSVRLANRLRTPLILDIFDQWPELFVLAFPKSLRWLAPIVFSPLYRLRRCNLRSADAITSLCDTYLALAKREIAGAHITPTPTLTAFNGINVTAFRDLMPKAGAVPGVAHQMGKNPDHVWVVYAGTLGNNYDIVTLLEAALQLDQRSSRVQIHIAGEGPLRPRITDFR